MSSQVNGYSFNIYEKTILKESANAVSIFNILH